MESGALSCDYCESCFLNCRIVSWPAQTRPPIDWYRRPEAFLGRP